MLAASSRIKGERRHIILAPNHRSFFDFILISYICFSLPELNIEIPFIAAADDFEHLPVFGWLAAKTNAFFLRRGRGKADPCLAETLDALKKDNGDQGVCIEVFIEGSRSRDRRFLRPKTGMLR
jgi:1-acyl-sn-glycerol-3-phosphate acyltransferase